MSYDLVKLAYGYSQLSDYIPPSALYKVDYYYLEREMLRAYGHQLFGEPVMNPKLFRVYNGTGGYIQSFETEAEATARAEELARSHPGTNYYVWKAIAKAVTATPPVTITKL
jgi:hypothetical protein